MAFYSTRGMNGATPQKFSVARIGGADRAEVAS